MSRMETPPTDAALATLAPLITPQERAMLERLPLLSNQERAVFVLIGQGLRTKEAAFELAISVKTAETHLARLRAKLDDGQGSLDLPELTFLARLWVRATAEAKGIGAI